jgi:hypothetical protein
LGRPHGIVWGEERIIFGRLRVLRRGGVPVLEAG